MMAWKPIAECEDIYAPGLLICAPELVDLDFNVLGISPGFYDDLAGPEAPDPEHPGKVFPTGSWVGLGWDGCNDEPTRVDCNPTHFLVLEIPQ